MKETNFFLNLISEIYPENQEYKLLLEDHNYDLEEYQDSYST